VRFLRRHLLHHEGMYRLASCWTDAIDDAPFVQRTPAQLPPAWEPTSGACAGRVAWCAALGASCARLTAKRSGETDQGPCFRASMAYPELGVVSWRRGSLTRPMVERCNEAKTEFERRGTCLHLTGVSLLAWKPAGKPTSSAPETSAETGQAAPIAHEGAVPAATTGTFGEFPETRQQATHALLSPGNTLAASDDRALAANRHQAIAGLPISTGGTASAIDGTLEALLAARIGKRAAFNRSDAEDLRKLRDHCPSRQTVRLEAHARSGSW
jgi:hypothetical protein